MDHLKEMGDIRNNVICNYWNIQFELKWPKLAILRMASLFFHSLIKTEEHIKKTSMASFNPI